LVTGLADGPLFTDAFPHLVRHLGWFGLEYVLYGALAGHVLAMLLAVAMSIHRGR
jgi:hypothetical protein